MVFWLGIVIALLLAGTCLKLGLFESWALFFNLLFSIYIAILAEPFISSFILQSGFEYVVIAVVAIALFALLQISFTFFLSQFKVPFHKLLDIVGGGSFGFLAGLLAWSFLVYVVSLSPVSSNKMLAQIGLDPAGFKQSQAEYLIWWCDKLHAFTALENAPKSTQSILLSKLDLKTKSQQSRSKKALHNVASSDPNQPPKSTPPQPEPSTEPQPKTLANPQTEESFNL